MSRRKTKKLAAKKRPVVKNSALNVQKMEMEILEAPAKLAAHLNKLVASLKQKEAKLQKAADKNQSQIIRAQKQLKSSAGKREHNKAKKSLAESMKAHSMLTKELKEATKSYESYSSKQTKFVELHKTLNQFEKEWPKKFKLLNSSKQTTKVKAARATRKAKSLPSVAEQPSIENFNTDNVMLNETTDITS